MKKFIYPEIIYRKHGIKPILAVYKMLFDDGKFYIGSTKNLKKRMWKWKTILSNGIKKNYLVQDAFKDCLTVRFEILEELKSENKLRVTEDKFIKRNWGDPLFLNRSKSAFAPVLVRTDEQIQNSRSFSKFKKPIALIDINGNILKNFESTSSAEREIGFKGISRCFINNLYTVKGLIFRKLDRNGNVIPAPIIPKKPNKTRDKGYKLSEDSRIKFKERFLAAMERKGGFKNSKKVNQLTTQGEQYKFHLSITAAVKSLGITHCNKMHEVLKKSQQGENIIYRGFIWKYA